LRRGDALALCRLGWHRNARGVWFRYAAGRTDAMRVYRMGAAPFDYRCTTVWSHGHPPMTCAACKEPIRAS
jgi:hypothetical protein